MSTDQSFVVSLWEVIGDQLSLFGIPVVSSAESYIASLELLLRNRREETRYGIEQMTAKRITSNQYLSIVYLVG